MDKKAKIRVWLFNTATGSIIVANVLVFLTGLLDSPQTYEPSFLAASAGVLILIHSMTGRRFAGFVAAVSAIGSGFLWMKSAVEGPNASLAILVIVALVMGISLILYGIFAGYIWLVASEGKKSGLGPNEDSSKSCDD